MQSEMQILNCKVGNWSAEAHIQEVESGKLMAVISVKNANGTMKEDSKHTVVFDHHAGSNSLEETEDLVRRLLQARYGVI